MLLLLQVKVQSIVGDVQPTSPHQQPIQPTSLTLKSKNKRYSPLYTHLLLLLLLLLLIHRELAKYIYEAKSSLFSSQRRSSEKC
ncbi:uncharacterized protein Dmoj_GI26116 [Drosophila mojavensis]|uniref:Uncharacterized protein n=1 Tax=Drosophila mojavensis TaxID=7230 RepID=A0A0Q9WM93_DROMO|nr:uncharacterized protein Dmoj_GI26116 [Drosophila mojavensis]